MLLYCHWHLNNLKCILPIQLKLLLCISFCSTKLCNWLLRNDTAGLKCQRLLSEMTCIFKYSFGNELQLCTYMIFQKSLLINLIWQHLLNCVMCCQNYYLKNKITELPYVARTNSINMHTFLFFVLKEHKLIEPCMLKGMFRGPFVFNIFLLLINWKRPLSLFHYEIQEIHLYILLLLMDVCSLSSVCSDETVTPL